MISQDQLKQFVSYNENTGKFFWIKNPAFNIKAGREAGSNRAGYRRICINKKTYHSHHLAWLYVYGLFPVMIDHINGVRSDNRIKNLRETTFTLNNQNQRFAKSQNKCGFLGVSPSRGKFRAAITINNKFKFLGRFSTPELAHSAYLEAKRKYHEGCTI